MHGSFLREVTSSSHLVQNKKKKKRAGSPQPIVATPVKSPPTLQPQPVKNEKKARKKAKKKVGGA